MAADDDHPHDVPRADVELTDPPRSAGGFGAIFATLRHIERDSGVARGAKALLAMNQVGGFDCPGCAWPEPAAAQRDRFEFCENGAKALAEEQTTARATPELFATVSIDELRQLSDFELGQLGRLTHPLIRDGRHYRAASWDEAIALTASELRAAGPQASVLYNSGRTSNEAAFLYQLVGRMFGTNNFPDCSNMCHDSSGIALTETIGVGKGTVSLGDFEHADLLFIVGQNPGTNHPRMLTTLRAAAKRGATIVAVNPLREVALTSFAHPQAPLDLLAAVPIAKHYVRIQIGGDHAFFQAIGKLVLERGAIDRAFVDAHTEGFEAWRTHVEAVPLAQLVEQSGVPEATIRQIADVYCGARSVIACWAMGLTQHKHAVATIQEIVNVMLLRGNVGRRGAGLCPVRGHSNVQGDRTMGIYHLPRAPFLDALGRTFGFEPPRWHGLDTAGALRGFANGELRAFFALGGNFVAAVPDTERVAASIERAAFTGSVSTKLNRTHLYPGARAVILPCLGRSEIDLQAGGPQFVTVEDSMSMVHRSQGVLPPASSELRSEPAIVVALGRALVGEGAAPWDDLLANYDRIREKIEAVIPGFEEFNRRVREPDGFQLPNVGRDGSFAPLGGRAKFSVAVPPDLTLPPGRLRLMTIRSHDQYNTTVYGLDDRYRGVRGERRVVFMSPADIGELGLVERQIVDLVSEHAGVERVAERFIVVPYDLPRRCAAAYFPEANALVPMDSLADKSRTPTSKSIVIRVRPLAATTAAP